MEVGSIQSNALAK